MTPSLEGWPTKAKEAPSPHEVNWPRWTPSQYFNVSGKLVFQCLNFNILTQYSNVSISLRVTRVNSTVLQVAQKFLWSDFRSKHNLISVKTWLNNEI